MLGLPRTAARIILSVGLPAASCAGHASAEPVPGAIACGEQSPGAGSQQARTTAVATSVTRESLEALPLRGSLDGAIDTIPGARPVAAWTLDGVLLPADEASEWPGTSSWRHVEAITVQRTSADASVHGGATRLGLVTRAGSSAFSGSATLDYTGRRLQWNNVTPPLRAQGAGFGNPIRREAEADLEAGGPIVRRRAWLWAAVARTFEESGIVGFYTAACLGPDGAPQPDAAYRPECMHPDVTTVITASARLQVQWQPANRSSFGWSRTDKRKPNRGASPFDRPEATTRQSGLGVAQPVRVQHAWAISDSFALDAALTASDGGLLLDFQEAPLAGIQGAYDRHTLVTSRSATQSRQVRQALHATASLTALSRDVLGGALSTRVGLECAGTSDRRTDRTGGGAVAVFDSRSGQSVSWQARIFRDGSTSHAERGWSAFLNDSLHLGRVTIDGGIRVDRQDDAALEATIPANAVLPDMLPAVRFAGADSGVAFTDVSPSAAVAWDVGVEARTVVRAGAARHRATGNDTSTPLQPTGQTRLTYWWTDTNRDGFVARDEIALERGFAATPSSNYDPANPASIKTPATVDRGLRNVITDELSVGAEHQLAPHVSVRASYVARRLGQMRATYRVNADGTPVSSDTYFPVQWTPSSCLPVARCPEVTSWQRSTGLPHTTKLRNDGRYAWRHGVDLVVHKRLSQGWMFDAAVAWNRSSMHFPMPTRDYTDPTNIAAWDGTGYSMPEPKWDVRLSGSARLPWQFRTSGIFRARQGLPYDRALSSPNRGALGSVNVSIARYGSERYPDVRSLDWRLEWHSAAHGLRIVPAVDVFNIFNSSTVLARNRIQNSATANRVTEVIAPRLLRLHVTVSW